MKKLKIFGSFLCHILLLGLFDYFFFTHALGNRTNVIWWTFSFYQVAIVSSMIMMILLRRLDKTLFIKALPSTCFLIAGTIYFVIASLLIVFGLKHVKATIILHAVCCLVYLLFYAVLGIYHRIKFPKAPAELVDEEPEVLEEAEVSEEPEEPEEIVKKPLVKTKSKTVMLLMTFVTDVKKWDNLKDMPFLEQLIEAASSCTQYTYEELLDWEEELNTQLKALKSYTLNNSVERAAKTARRVMNLLEEREQRIADLEIDA